MIAPETSTAAVTGTPAAVEINSPPYAAMNLPDLQDVLDIAGHYKNVAGRNAAAEFAMIDQTGSYLLGVLRFDVDCDALVYDPRRYGEEA